MFDMNAMMGKMQEAQQKLKQAQDNLVNITAEGEAGAGMVKATINGKKQIISVDIDESLMTPTDRQMVQDLTVAAINKALENIEPKIKSKMQEATSGVIPNIPGLDLGNIMNNF